MAAMHRADMDALPQCKHRGAPVRPGWFVCAHPQVMAPEGADAEACRVCAAAGVFCDRDPIVPPKNQVRTHDPRVGSRPWNLLKSLRDFVGDGCRTLSLEQYRERLMICTHCPQRERNTCSICGCHLALKARGRAFKCPLERWPPVQ